MFGSWVLSRLLLSLSDQSGFPPRPPLPPLAVTSCLCPKEWGSVATEGVEGELWAGREGVISAEYSSKGGCPHRCVLQGRNRIVLMYLPAQRSNRRGCPCGCMFQWWMGGSIYTARMVKPAQCGAPGACGPQGLRSWTALDPVHMVHTESASQANVTETHLSTLV